jgi:glutamate/tyrosine decarboxylase-like PLP-dependent enzyme
MSTEEKRLPRTGWDKSEIWRVLADARSGDANWREGRIWSLVYFGGKEHTDFLAEVFRDYVSENGLSPSAFPSLRRFEREVISMLRHLLGGDEHIVGTMTSGGTESILLAVKAYRDQARLTGKGNGTPEMLVPASAHPAFLKAARYFDVTPVVLPVGGDFRADIEATAKAISERTILLVASAPCFPYGTIDPIDRLGALAQTHGVGLHIDACVGGIILPFLRRLGKPVPPFDFAVPGVTSMSVDLHKYGYALKGASAVLYRSPELRRHQFFVETAWLGGLFGSPAMLGTRPGGIIAAAWAAMMAQGELGYMDLAHRTWDLSQRIQRGIAAIPGLRVVGRPDMTLFAFTSDTLDIFAVANRLSERGWYVDRQNEPRSIHLVVTPNHEQAVDPFLRDLAEVADEVAASNPGASSERAMLYGVTTQVTAGDNPSEAIIQGMEESLDGV